MLEKQEADKIEPPVAKMFLAHELKRVLRKTSLWTSLNRFEFTVLAFHCFLSSFSLDIITWHIWNGTTSGTSSHYVCNFPC